MASNTVKIFKFNEIDLSKLQYTGVRSLKNNKMVTYIGVNYAGEPLYIQTPILLSTSGFSMFEDPASGKPTYTMPASFPSADGQAKDSYNLGAEDYAGEASDPYYEMGQFYNFMRRFQAKIVKDIAKNSVEWFKEDEPLDEKTVLKYKFNPFIKFSKDKAKKTPDGKYPPSIQFKIGYDAKTQKFQGFNAYDFEKNPVDLDADNLKGVFPKGVRFNGLLNLTGLWFSSGKLSPSFKLIQMRKQTAKAKAVPVHCVLDDDEVEEGGGLGNECLVDDGEIPAVQVAESHEEVSEEAPQAQPEVSQTEKPKGRRLKGKE
jgi:hypothetical protein